MKIFDTLASPLALFLTIPGILVAQSATGTISGTVTLRGESPAPRFLERPVVEGCADRPLVDQSQLVSTGGRVPWAFLWIAKGKLPEPEQGALEPVTMRLEGCQFLPHVVAIRKGQALRFQNEDATRHGVVGRTRTNPSFEEELAPHGGAKEVVLTQEELLGTLECAEHPWMRSTLWVIGHPFFAISDGEGRYRIENVPPGTYAVAIGHESFQGLGKLVHVKAGETTPLDFFVTAGSIPSGSKP